MEFNKQEILAHCQAFSKNTLMQTLDIEFIDAGPEFLTAKMPVNARVHQPLGLLHGGATVALAESVGSSASFMLINTDEEEARGIEISANHLRSKRDGTVYATARILHKGRTLHLWEIRITDEDDRLISICKITNMILKK
ncbi:PaaI family thioesterase [Flavobacterium sp. JP2137]|uniref:PaaI family thioesterase n=1 Tax=Flavobacterium sp. JP2137 TaxID=3414510 RepID=UPI003D300F1C